MTKTKLVIELDRNTLLKLRSISNIFTVAAGERSSPEDVVAAIVDLVLEGMEDDDACSSEEEGDSR